VGTVTFGAGKGGNVTVDAQNVQLIGRTANGSFASGLAALAERNSTGDAGDLTLRTNTLLIQDGAQMGTSTFSAGKGGNLTVDAQDVQLIGFGAGERRSFASGLYAAAEPNSTGDAGSLTVRTNTLLIQDGARVSVSTEGAGKGGNLNIDAQDVQLIGRSANGQFPSALAASAAQNSTGDAGSLTIKTNTLLVRNGAQVSTGTSGAGKGGNLNIDAQDVQLIGTGSGLGTSAQPNSTGDAGDSTIKTNTLLVQDGAVVNAATFGSGKGGNLNIDAQDVQLIGTGSGLFASTTPNSTGDAGDLTIKTNTLLGRDGAAVSVQSLGTGTAGNMTLNARSIRLDKNTLLTASTQSAKVDPNREQATININSQDLIISRNSNINTNATGENVIGGNINIDTDVLVAIENSDITANSANFRGGKVRINTQGIFRSPDSDITATGGSPELGGSVEINRPDVDQILGLVELPTVLADTSQLIADTGCAAVASTDSDTEKTVLLSLDVAVYLLAPYEPLSTDVVWLDTRLADITSQHNAQRNHLPNHRLKMMR
jgi:large exoprotein involved in heme utilization and adhesion